MHMPGRFHLFLLTVALSLVAAPQAWGEEDIAARMQQTYESLQSFDAKFAQVLRNPTSGEEQERSGMLFFKKPNLVRWETTQPENELLIVGRVVVWDYFADEGVAYKYATDNVLDSKTMIRFISGQARLDQDFWITPEGEEGGLKKLDLVPKEPEPQLVRAFVWVEPETAMLRKILLQDFYGNENEVSFEDVRTNPDMPDDLFEFEPPLGTEVLDNTVQFGVQQ